MDKIRKREHDKMQHTAYMYFHNNIPELRYCLHANLSNPSNKISGAQLKGMGLTKGRADMELNLCYKTYFIEIKQGKDTLRKEQKSFKEAMEINGFDFYECRTVEEIKALIFSIIKELKKRCLEFYNYYFCKESRLFIEKNI